MSITLTSANKFLRDMYLELVQDILQGKKVPTVEEMASECIEKLDIDH